jgi:PAS domain S-box-containing protein
MKPNIYPTHLKFLEEGGQMGEIMRQKNWSETVLGAPELWPKTLKNTLSLLLNSQFPMLLYWGSDHYCFYNDAFRLSLGQDGKHPKILGMKGKDAWMEMWSDIKPLLSGVFTNGKSTWHENMLLPLNRNGKLEEAYWTFSYSPIRNEEHIIEGVLTICVETTDKVIALNRLEESEDELKFAIEATDLGTWDYNPVHDKLRTNNRLKQWFGLPITEEIELSQATNAIIEKDRDRVNTAIQKAFDWSGGGKYDITYTIRNKKSGRERFVRALGRAWFNEEKVAFRFNGTLQDITDQQEILEKLKSNEERFRRLVKEIPVGIAIIDVKNYVIKVVNDMALLIWQKTHEEAINKPLFEVLTEIEKTITPIFEELMFTKKASRGMEYPFILERNGVKETGYFNFIFKPTVKNNEVTEIMLVAFEVTDAVKAKFELEESERQFKNFVMQSPVAMGILRGENMEVEMANDTLLNVFWRKKSEEVLGKGLLDIFPNLAESKYPDVIRGIFKTGIPVSEKESYAALEDETGFWEFYVDYIYAPLRELDGNISGVMVTTTDVTERVKARKKLENFSKELEIKVQERTDLLTTANDKLQYSIAKLENANAELESFAYVSSHDLQEPLRKIQMYISRILEKEKMTLSENGKNYFDKITISASRMRTLIDDLLAFSRSNESESEYEMVDLNVVFNEVLEHLSDGIESSKASVIAQELPQIYAVPFQMQQVFSNLISNAIKFSKKDVFPAITISTELANKDEIAALKLRKNHVYHKITIADNGIGLPKGMENKIFEVFQRVHGKHEYEGTGIGLAIVKKIIINHGGVISLESIENHGSSFILYLPKI